MKLFMRNIGIDVQIQYTHSNAQCLDFSYDMFDKKTMIDWSELRPKVKTEYMQYTIDTLNRYFGIVASQNWKYFKYDMMQMTRWLN